MSPDDPVDQRTEPNWTELPVERKHWALRPQELLRLIKDEEVRGLGIFVSNTYSLHCHHQNDCIKVGSCVTHFNVSFVVWAKSQDSVHEPQFLKRKESRSGSNRGPSAYQPSALPLGHTGPQPRETCRSCFIASSEASNHRNKIRKQQQQQQQSVF